MVSSTCGYSSTWLEAERIPRLVRKVRYANAYAQKVCAGRKGSTVRISKLLVLVVLLFTIPARSQVTCSSDVPKPTCDAVTSLTIPMFRTFQGTTLEVLPPVNYATRVKAIRRTTRAQCSSYVAVHRVLDRPANSSVTEASLKEEEHAIRLCHTIFSNKVTSDTSFVRVKTEDDFPEDVIVSTDEFEGRGWDDDKKAVVKTGFDYVQMTKIVYFITGFLSGSRTRMMNGGFDLDMVQPTPPKD